VLQHGTENDELSKGNLMDFWIVAIDHKLQLAKRVNDLPKTAALKEQLEAILKEEIPKRHVRFIAEESKIGEVTIAAAIGDASDPKIPWVNISMSDTVERTLRQAGDAQSVLMLLGDLHVDAVGEKLNQLGHRVSTNHDLFPVRRWE
jgi:transposase